MFFHQGAPALGDGALRTDRDLQALRTAAAHLSPAGQLQVATALDMLAGLEDRLDVVRHRLLDAARSLTGARVLAARLYGVGPVTGLALTCWLGGAGRFSSSRQAVRFAGLDIQRPQGRQARRPLRGPQDRPPGLPHPGRARRRRAHRRLSPAIPYPMVAIVTWQAGPASRSRTHQMGHNRGQLPPVRCQPLPALPRRARRTACID